MMENLMLCTKCGKCVHGRCMKRNRVPSTLAKGFVCKRYVEAIKGIVKPHEELPFHNQVTLVKMGSMPVVEVKL